MQRISGDKILGEAITACKTGRRAEARAMLEQLLEQDPLNEQAWLWLSGAVETDAERRSCLKQVLNINPDHPAARRGLERLGGTETAAPPGEAPALQPLPLSLHSPPQRRIVKSSLLEESDRTWSYLKAPARQDEAQVRRVLFVGIPLAALLLVLTIVLGNKFIRERPPAVPPLYPVPYVVVYGRTSCGICSGLMDDLDRQGIPYYFKPVDDPAVGEELYPRMQESGLRTSSFGLPVVDVNGYLMVRPSVGEVEDKYHRLPPTAEP